MKNLHAIRKQLGVTIVTISKYNSEHREEIEHIGDIFDLKGDNKEKLLALLYMLSPGEEDTIIQTYREQTGLSGAEHDSANLVERYKVPLLTALAYNRALYAMVANYRGFISAGLPVAKTKEESEHLQLVRTNNGGDNRVINFPKSEMPDAIAAESADIVHGKGSDMSFD